MPTRLLPFILVAVALSLAACGGNGGFGCAAR
jgi:predicted small secreted protein